MEYNWEYGNKPLHLWTTGFQHRSQSHSTGEQLPFQQSAGITIYSHAKKSWGPLTHTIHKK